MDERREAGTRGKIPETTPAPAMEWSQLVERIRRGDPGGMEELYRCFSRGVRFYLCRRLGRQELEDKVHDTFLIVVQAIRRGDLREPERLMGFVRTVVKRQVAAHIEAAVQERRELEPLEEDPPLSDGQESPEEELLRKQRWRIMKEVLDSISRRDREILTRFYLLEQTQEQICAEMNLTDTQFRLLKSRAKARFGELGRRAIARKPLSRFLLRKAAGSSH